MIENVLVLFQIIGTFLICAGVGYGAGEILNRCRRRR